VYVRYYNSDEFKVLIPEPETERTFTAEDEGSYRGYLSYTRPEEGKPKPKKASVGQKQQTKAGTKTKRTKRTG
jgi:hypothetical protein